MDFARDPLAKSGERDPLAIEAFLQNCEALSSLSSSNALIEAALWRRSPHRSRSPMVVEAGIWFLSRGKMPLLLILRERKEDGEVGTNLEEGLEIDSSENAKDEATELSFVLAEAKEEEKESEEKKAIVRNTPMVPVSDVIDVSIEFVESKEEAGSSNFEGETFVVEKDSEILVQNLIEEESVVHTTEQEVEASEAQESLPTSSVSCEDNSVVYTTAAAITDEKKVWVVIANGVEVGRCCVSTMAFLGRTYLIPGPYMRGVQSMP